MSRRWQRGRVSYERARDVYERVYGEDNARLAAFYSSMGFILFKCHQYEQAFFYYKRGFAISENTLPPLHPDLAYYHNKIAVIYSELNQIDEAIEHHLKGLEVGISALPPDNHLIVELYYNLGIAYKRKGNASLAKEYFAKQIDTLNIHLNTPPLMQEIHQIVGRRIHYICPRCGLPTWVFFWCRMLQGRTCTRCLRDILQCQATARVAPEWVTTFRFVIPLTLSSVTEQQHWQEKSSKIFVISWFVFDISLSETSRIVRRFNYISFCTENISKNK